MSKWLYGPNAFARLREAGLIGEGVQRVVIDMPHDDYATVYVQTALNEELLAIVIDAGGNDNRRGLQVKSKGGIGGSAKYVIGENGPETFHKAKEL